MKGAHTHQHFRENSLESQFNSPKASMVCPFHKRTTKHNNSLYRTTDRNISLSLGTILGLFIQDGLEGLCFVSMYKSLKKTKTKKQQCCKLPFSLFKLLKRINIYMVLRVTSLKSHLFSSSGWQVRGLQRPLAALGECSQVCPLLQDWLSHHWNSCPSCVAHASPCC